MPRTEGALAQLSPAVSPTPRPFLRLTGPSFNKHTLQITWAPIVKSLLPEVKNPHSRGWPEAVPLQPGPFLVTEETIFQGLGAFSVQRTPDQFGSW